MTGSVQLIPRGRLRWIPKHLRYAHEYTFFLHDEGARILVEYEGAEAHVVSFKFRDKAEGKRFKQQAVKAGPIDAMRSAGYEMEARRVILNQITMAMVADCLHHIYEALRCLEKRKIVVALNLLRKPLTDNLLYMSWMLGDEDGFYEAFIKNSPHGITSSILKSRRADIISKALINTSISGILNSEFIDRILFDTKNRHGFQMLFQHAVHLITVQRVELQTEPENFNFIFKNHTDDDLYEAVYETLPHIMLFLSHVIVGLFERICPPDAPGKTAFDVRSIVGLYLVEGGDNEAYATELLKGFSQLRCPACAHHLKVTAHNVGRLALTESFRCSRCRRKHPFLFSWAFESDKRLSGIWTGR